MSAKPRIAVSSCLLGEPVRYDGARKRVDWIAFELPLLADLIPVCPEVGAGMGVPRPAIRVVRDDARFRLRIVESGDETGVESGDTIGGDVTHAFDVFADAEIVRLRALHIDGYLFKARSPSCGLIDTPHFSGARLNAAELGIGAGLWAARIRAEFPAIALADEGELREQIGRERFVNAALSHLRARTQP